MKLIKERRMLDFLQTFKIVSSIELLPLVPNVSNRIGTSIQKCCLTKCISVLLSSCFLILMTNMLQMLFWK